MLPPWRPRGPDDLDERRRAQIRREVLAAVRPRRPGPRDRAYGALSLVAAPAPHIVRLALSGALVLGVVASATVASAESLPDEPLYAVKLASEQMRLALALTPEDLAAIELSVADHRLDEAERLALDGREADALVATTTYGQHLANAAAALASVERSDPAARPVVEQLAGRVAEQQRRAADVARRLAARPAAQAAAPAFQTVASSRPSPATGATVAESIAEHAAAVSEQIAKNAERPRPAAGAATPAARVAQAAREAAERAKHEAEKARAAAERAKEAAKRTPSPRPTPKR